MAIDELILVDQERRFRKSRPICTRSKRSPRNADGILRQASPCPLAPISCARLNMAQLMNRGSGLRIGKILGIPIYLHASWVIVFSLITFPLAMQFAQEHPRWSTVQHWSVGILTSFLFFGSVLFHELSHSVVAQRYKIRVVSITLFIFGGVDR